MNVYLINKEIAWKSWGTNYKYAKFGTQIIISESEQERATVKDTRINMTEIKSNRVDLSPPQERRSSDTGMLMNVTYRVTTELALHVTHVICVT